MTEIEKWHVWFLQQYGDIRNSFVRFESENTRLISVFFSSYFKHYNSHYTGGALVDIGVCNKSGKVSAVGATFSKDDRVMYISKNAIVFDNRILRNRGRLTFTGENKRLSESVEGFIEFEIDDNSFRLVDLNVSLLFWNNDIKKYVPVKQWDMEEYESSEFEVLCNNCFGQGEFKCMSIPKAFYESGMTGYELYSYKTINGIYGCNECGGSGAIYEYWYLSENPQLASNKERFRKGWGSIPQRNVNEVVIPKR